MNGTRSAPESPSEERREDKWDRFVFWADRWHTWPGFVDFERGYKDEIVDQISQARLAVSRNAPDWWDVLKRAFGKPSNLTDWRDHDPFLKWAAKFPDTARSALRVIWDPKLKLDERVRGFIDGVPREALRSPLPIASFLLMGASKEHYPIYRKTPFAAAYKLAGFPPAGGEADKAGEYRHALRFMDRLIIESHKRGLDVPTRLDAQSLVWCITMEEPPPDWAEADRHAFLEYRGPSGRSPIS